MSCLGPGYNPNPTRAWSRVQSQCTYLSPDETATTAYIPVLKKSVPLGDVQYELSMINKGNVLQYKCNSANITKSQKYSLIAKGAWNRKKVWATQTQSYSNPNSNSFQRVNYPGIISVKPGTSQQAAELCQNNTIPDGGNLNGHLIVNQCTGAVIQKLVNNNCFPTSCSDVPGPIIGLCYNNNFQTWYPKQRYYMSNSANKFPEGYKGFVSANSIPNANKTALNS
jgi:hypothetical protein